MLKLTSVTKDYKVADSTVRALKGVSLAFRKNEFVSVLGPSGCGKTTLLNIIGGLDKYTSGELTIAGRDTSSFTAADWDVYRNHRVGFIFQSYNLIPHQTILGNVELALTIAGISKTERRERAMAALDKVGLQDQYNKKPNQLSGGQCQRVAIARALVNEPEILLADEPTGALDTVTSVQIMDLIKEIASERLVIMVTHNPELAEKYSTRIIRLLDGEVEGDTNPFTAEAEAEEIAAMQAEQAQIEAQEVEKLNEKQRKKYKKSKEKAKMSLWTAIRLSAQNLFTKKSRTLMTSIAGSIGIIGVSLVLALSFGITSYINGMQNDMMSGNPITVTESTFDMSAFTSTMTPSEKKEFVREHGYVNVDSMVDTLIGYSKTADSLMIKNEITQDYIDYVTAMPKEDVAAVFLDYGLDIGNNIYTDFRAKADGDKQTLSVSAIRNMYISILEQTVLGTYSSYITNIVDNFRQAPAGEDYIAEQYDVLEGKIATEKDEIMIVLNGETALSDVLLAQLGYYTQDEFMHLVYKSASSAEAGYNVSDMQPFYGDESLAKPKFTYEELLGKTFTYYPNEAIYNYQGVFPTGANSSAMAFSYNHEANAAWNTTDGKQGLPLKVVGIICPKKNVSYGCMDNGFYYTAALTQYAIERNKTSEIVSKITEQTALPEGDSNKVSNVTDGVLTSGVRYTFNYVYKGENLTDTAQIGEANMMGNMMGMEMFTLSLSNLAGSELASAISIYPKDFTRKEHVLAYLDAWNGDGDVTVNGTTLSAENRERIIYTDTLTLVISLINGFIDIVTIALVGFTALSLVVSSVMIGIITYVSVVERTKEIGVIRSLGGRKKDVSRLFTAETAIIGFASGAIGVGITYLLSAVINIIVGKLTIVSTIAALPVPTALIMVAISVILTLFSGVFPARAAAKKDPVVALRTE